MRWLRAWLGVRVFNLHAEGRDGETLVVADIGGLPEKHLDEVVDIITSWDYPDIHLVITEAR